MDDIGAFLAMGGYAGFVWSAYGVASQFSGVSSSLVAALP